MLNPIIETAIGLVFVYLLLSMVCSSLQEFLAALFAFRASSLREGISSMLPQGKTDKTDKTSKPLVDQIYEHPLISTLGRRSWWDKITRRKQVHPSYIPADAFARAFIDVAGLVTPTGGLVAKAQLPSALPKDTPTDIQKLLETYLTYSPDLNTLLTNIEDWYNNTMDRVSGWYKRKAQSIILLIALVVACIANADTLTLVSAFWHDPTLRAAAVTAATEYVKNNQGQKTLTTEKDKADLFPSTTQPGAAPQPPREETLGQATKNLTDTISQVQTQLTKINVPLGWSCASLTDRAEQENAQTSSKAPAAASNNPASKNPTSDTSQGKQQKTIEAESKCAPGQQWPPTDWWLKIAGLLLTVLAISQGAPFWFDLLQKLVNLRLAGNPPPASKQTAKT